MSVYTVINGQRKELTNLVQVIDGVRKPNTQYYATIDSVDKQLLNSLDDNDIVEIKLMRAYQYVALFENGSSTSNTKVDIDTALSYLNLSVNGNTIVVSPKQDQTRIYLYLRVWIGLAGGIWLPSYSPGLMELIQDKLTLNYQMQFVRLATGTGTSYDGFAYISNTSYKTTVDNFTSLQNTWYTGHLTPLYNSKGSSQGDLRIGSGNSKTTIVQRTYQLANPTWNGREIPLSIDLT